MKLYTVAGGNRSVNGASSLSNLVRSEEEAMKIYLSFSGGGWRLGDQLSITSFCEGEESGMKLWTVATALSTSNTSLAHIIEGTPAYSCRFLASYYYLRLANAYIDFMHVAVKKEHEIFVDSGAYSAMTQGDRISVDAYATWIVEHQSYITLYANLDVIRNGAKTLEHQKRMEEEYGLSPLPVFHVAEDWKYLEYYLDHYPYIALGVAGMHAASYTPWLIKCFAMAKGRAVYHGFGITNWTILTMFPWYSVDSASWSAGMRFGRIAVFDPARGKFCTVKLGDRESCYQYASLLRSYGYDPEDFADRTRNKGELIRQLSLSAYRQAERWLTEKWGEMEVPA